MALYAGLEICNGQRGAVSADGSSQITSVRPPAEESKETLVFQTVDQALDQDAHRALPRKEQVVRS